MDAIAGLREFAWCTSLSLESSARIIGMSTLRLKRILGQRTQSSPIQPQLNRLLQLKTLVEYCFLAYLNLYGEIRTISLNDRITILSKSKVRNADDAVGLEDWCWNKPLAMHKDKSGEGWRWPRVSRTSRVKEGGCIAVLHPMVPASPIPANCNRYWSLAAVGPSVGSSPQCHG